MSHRLVKLVLYLALLTVMVMLSAGLRLSWPLYAIAIIILSIMLLYADFEQRHYDSRMISLISVMVAVTVVSRQFIHGVEFSPVFFLTILTGYVFGFTPGFAVGSMIMLVSNFFIGHGPWTPFQMMGLGFCGGFAGLLPELGKGTPRLLLLTGYAFLTAFFYGLFLDLLSWMLFIPTHTLESYIAIALVGMVANTSRAVGNVFFMLVFSNAVLRVLYRFKIRFTLEYTD